MIRKVITRSATAVLLAALTVAATPRSAEACLWSMYHEFMPFPPCEVDDVPGRAQLQAANRSLLAKVTTTAEKIRQVRTEIRQWQRAQRTALSFEQRLRSAWGDLTAPPLPSLVAAYNRTPAGAWVRLNAEGGLEVSATVIDLRAAADSVWMAFQDSANLRRIYRDGVTPRIGRLDDRLTRSRDRLDRSLTRLADFERYREQARDSLLATSERLSSRYSGEAETQGLAEARISGLSATLNRLQGSAFETQAQVLRARLSTLEASQSTGAHLDRRQAQMSSYSRF